MDMDEATRRLIGDPRFHNLLDIKRADKADARLAHKILIVCALLMVAFIVYALVQ
jgi:hypothetical protein